jgi:hypothetical protein
VVNVQYVDEYFMGRVKMPVRLMDDLNFDSTYDSPSLALTATSDYVLEVDGVTAAAGDRVLLVGQTDKTQNGIYSVTDPGTVGTPPVLTRADDFDKSSKIYDGVRIAVAEGDDYKDSTWKLVTDGSIVLDTTELTFVQDTGIAHTNKYTNEITGDDAKTIFAFNHNLGTVDIEVQFRNVATGNPVWIDYTIVDADTINVTFITPPATGDRYQIIIIG